MALMMRRIMIGVQDGNFHPTSQPREEFLKTLMRAKEKNVIESATEYFDLKQTHA